jgi:flagellar basal-body rod protein FlgB
VAVSDISDAAIIAALRRQMSIAVAKQTVAAGNLANVDTPGYRAREIDFSRVLDDRLAGSGTLLRTNANHLSGAEPATVASQEVVDAPARRDGNTVQLDKELLAMSRASGEFAKAQTALAAKFRLVRYALTEGR